MSNPPPMVLRIEDILEWGRKTTREFVNSFYRKLILCCLSDGTTILLEKKILERNSHFFPQFPSYVCSDFLFFIVVISPLFVTHINACTHFPHEAG